MKQGLTGLFLLISICIITFPENQVSIVGCGYVGLAMAAVFSDSGHTIICIDTDRNKISQLKNNVLPIYEPELAERLFFSPQSKHIVFTNDFNDAKDSDVYFVCVPTPTNTDGDCDRTYLYSAFDSIINICGNAPAIICIKSTVSPGTIRSLYTYLQEQELDNIELVYNPEFMREGCALQDIYTKNPVILGSESAHAIQNVETFYRSFLSDNTKFLKTNFETAEIIKYAWNSFSAIRIAYVNELADLCSLLHGDISKVVQGIALSEELLPTAVLKPGPGYGGSCFPKDTSGFKNLLKTQGFASSLVQQAIESNELHKERLIQDILANVTQQQGTVTLLGLSFKANTNDIRSAPSIDIIRALMHNGLTIKAYDPQAIQDMKRLFPEVHYYKSPYEAIKNTDCIVVLTEWDQIKQIDLEKASQLCHKKNIVDARNLYDVSLLKKFGFNYINMGAF